jgi:hypothetical protein
MLYWRNISVAILSACIRRISYTRPSSTGGWWIAMGSSTFIDDRPGGGDVADPERGQDRPTGHQPHRYPAAGLAPEDVACCISIEVMRARWLVKAISE